MLRVTNLIGFGARRLVAAAAVPVVWNSLDKTGSVTLSNGDKTATSGASNNGVRGNVGKSTGKWYCEMNITPGSEWNASANVRCYGIATASFVTLGSTGPGDASGSAGIVVNLNTFRLDGGSTVTNNPDPGTAGSGGVIMLAFDAGAGNLWFGFNGTWCGVGGVTGDPATGTAPSLSSIPAGTYYPCISRSGSSGRPVDLWASVADCTYAPPPGFSYWAA